MLCLLMPALAQSGKSTQELKALMGGLRDVEFSKREQAMGQLWEWANGQETKEALSILVGYWKIEDDPEVKVRLHQLLKKRFLAKKRGFLGVRFAVRPGAIYQEKRVCALEIREVIPGESAERAGLKKDDLVLALNGKTFPNSSTSTDVNSRIGALNPGEEIKITIEREQKRMDILLFLGARAEKYEDDALRTRLFEKWLKEQLENRN